MVGMAFALLTLTACADSIPTAPTPGAASGSASLRSTGPLTWLRSYLRAPSTPSSADPAVLAGAGDIARCYPGAAFREFRFPAADHPAAQTARLLDGMPGATVMTLGDNAYEFGSPMDYWGCHHPT